MKQHYVGLDGLRGIAALAVMLMHEIGIFRPALGPVIHAGVAVDLFFMLSGFVLAFAYDSRLERGMSWATFMLARVIRLYPMLVLAMLLSGAVSLIRLLVLHTVPPDESLSLLPAALLLLPTGLFMGKVDAFSGSSELIAFCFPAWSLLFELVGSAAFATRLGRSGLKTGALLFFGASLLLVGLTISAGTITVLGMQGYVGAPAGLARMSVSFAIGVVLFRNGAFIRLPRVPVPLSIIAGGVLCSLPLAASPVFDLACVFILFPLLVCLCAQPVSSQAAQRTFSMLGALSYPIYLLHVPIARIVGFAIKAVMPGVGSTTLIVASMAGCGVASFLALGMIDEPVRRRLTTMFQRKSSRGSRRGIG